MKAAIIDSIKLFWPTVVVVIVITLIMRITMIIKSERKSFCLHEELYHLAFIVYLMILFQLVTSQDISGGGTNLMPFREIFRYEFGSTGFYKQVVGNILIFVPLGYFMSSDCHLKSLLPVIVTCGLSSLCIEIVQHFIGRSFDIDDIILNIIGGIVGFLLYIALNAIKNHLPKFMRQDWFYNLISVILIILCAIYVFKLF